MAGRPTYVIDCSVLLKWVLNEPGRDAATAWLDRYQDGEALLIAPTFVLAEAGGVLSKMYRRKELTVEGAREGFDWLEAYSPQLVPLAQYMRPAMELSMTHQIAIHDCLYLTLALERRCDLITADHRFFAATTRAYPCVRLLDEGEPRRVM